MIYQVAGSISDFVFTEFFWSLFDLQNCSRVLHVLKSRFSISSATTGTNFVQSDHHLSEL